MTCRHRATLLRIAFSLLVVLAWLAPATAEYRETILGDSPVGYWLFEEPGGGSTIDVSGHERDLTYSLFNSGFDEPGALGGGTGIRFTPDAGGNPTIFSDNTVDFGFDAGNSFSMEYWLKAAPGNASSQHAGILTKGYDVAQVRPWYLSRLSNVGQVDFYLRDIDGVNSVATASTNILDDSWHHIVGVYDADLAEVQIYVDSVLESFTGGVPEADYGTNAAPFTLGNHLSRAVDAALDEVAMYDYSLSGEQVLTHFLEGGGTPPPPPPPPINLDVDFGSVSNNGGGPGGVQRSFYAFEGNEEDGTDPMTSEIPTQLGVDENVSLTLGGFTHFRDYSSVDPRDASVDRLLSDMVLRNAEGTLTMTLENLLPGTYEMTTFHHSTQFGGGTLDVSLSDSRGVDQSVVTSLPVSASDGGSLTSAVFNVTTDGSPVTVSMSGGSDQDHLVLNGFRLREADLRQRVELLAVDLNDRGAAESVDPTVTQDEFSEIILDGIENDDVDFPTIRDVDGYTIAITVPAGSLIGDRRRDVPVNGAFFTESELLRDFIFARGATEEDGIDVLVTGLPANQPLEVTVWSADDGSPTTRVADWFANGDEVVSDYGFDGADLPPSPPFNDTYSFSFDATSNEDGELLFSGRQSGAIDPGVFLNAFRISAIIEAALNCDFDGNKLCELADIDALLDALGTNNAMFDLDGSGTVDDADIADWLVSAGNENIGRAYLGGDANLDGFINALDLNAVGVNWQSTTATSWIEGDFDGNGSVTAEDLNILGINWQQTAGAAAVPEPSGCVLGLAGLMFLARGLRRK